jgi:hypothetical protein
MENSLASMFEPASLGMVGAARVAVAQRLREPNRLLT